MPDIFLWYISCITSINAIVTLWKSWSFYIFTYIKSMLVSQILSISRNFAQFSIISHISHSKLDFSFYWKLSFYHIYGKFVILHFQTPGHVINLPCDETNIKCWFSVKIILNFVHAFIFLLSVVFIEFSFCSCSRVSTIFCSVFFFFRKTCISNSW